MSDVSVASHATNSSAISGSGKKINFSILLPRVLEKTLLIFNVRHITSTMLQFFEHSSRKICVYTYSYTDRKFCCTLHLQSVLFYRIYATKTFI